MFQCECCKKSFRSLAALGSHLTKKHPEITAKDYYDNFLKSNGDGICSICGHPTGFLSLAGYRKTCSKECHIKQTKKQCEKTFIERYGVRSPMQNSAMKERIKNTIKEKYSCNFYTQSATFKEKSEHTKTIKYNDKTFNNRDKAKITMSTRYGAPTTLESSILQEKIKETCMQKYGCENPMQNHEIQTKAHKSIVFNDINFDSSWELIYYLYLKAKNIKFEFHPKIKFSYSFKNEDHYYFPDFKIENDFIEIKGPHFFENGKMINPYDRSQDPLYEAKHQCMIRNHVKIITNCKNEMNFILEFYGNEFIKEILK